MYAQSYILLLFFAMIMFYACTTNPDFPNEPHLEYVSLSKNTIKQSILFNDTIQLKMTFTDGDGDLGSDDSLSLFITDTRDQQMIPAYKIPFIPPQGSGNGISGELFVNLPPTCCIYEDGSLPCSPNPNEPTDTLTYEIYIKDRAGNSSNKVTTDPIYLQCND